MSKEYLGALEIIYNNAKMDRNRIEQGYPLTYAEEIEHNERIKPYYDTVKQALLNSQEQEKVLNIIKKKNVDIIYLKESNNVEEYNSHFGCAVCKLTQEEFELLKKYFND